jgi:hypothetical protein
VPNARAAALRVPWRTMESATFRSSQLIDIDASVHTVLNDGHTTSLTAFAMGAA